MDAIGIMADVTAPLTVLHSIMPSVITEIDYVPGISRKNAPVMLTVHLFHKGVSAGTMDVAGVPAVKERRLIVPLFTGAGFVVKEAVHGQGVHVQALRPVPACQGVNATMAVHGIPSVLVPLRAVVSANRNVIVFPGVHGMLSPRDVNKGAAERVEV